MSHQPVSLARSFPRTMRAVVLVWPLALWGLIVGQAHPAHAAETHLSAATSIKARLAGVLALLLVALVTLAATPPPASAATAIPTTLVRQCLDEEVVGGFAAGSECASMKAHYESQGCTVTTTDVGSAFETDTLTAECPFNPAPYPDPTPDPAPLPTSPPTPDPDPDSCDAAPTSGSQAGSVAAIAASAVQDQTAGPRVWKCFSGGGFTSDFALSVALVKMAAWSTANLHHCLPTFSRTEELGPGLWFAVVEAECVPLTG